MPLDERGFRLAMGLRPLDHNQWFERDAEANAQCAAKTALLDHHYEEVVAVTPEGTVASGEVAAMIATFVGAPLTTNDHPLVAASRLVADDLCVMVRTRDDWVLAAAVVCSPSRWSLREKIGTSLDAIHETVPGYAEALASSTRTRFDRLRPERSFWRLNWTLLDDPALFQPSVRRRAPQGDPAAWWFRVERQTLRALPSSGAVLFTIRTYVTALPELLSADPEHGARLLRALDTAPEASTDYKGWRGVADALRATLSSPDRRQD